MIKIGVEYANFVEKAFIYICFHLQCFGSYSLERISIVREL
jgi:hypothetical protein